MLGAVFRTRDRGGGVTQGAVQRRGTRLRENRPDPELMRSDVADPVLGPAYKPEPLRCDVLEGRQSVVRLVHMALVNFEYCDCCDCFEWKLSYI